MVRTLSWKVRDMDLTFSKAEQEFDSESPTLLLSVITTSLLNLRGAPALSLAVF